MATIDTGDIALTTQLDIVECEAIEATDQSATQSTAYRRPISIYANGPTVTTVTVPLSRWEKVEQEADAISFTATAAGANPNPSTEYYLHYDFMEIKEDSLLDISNIQIQVDCQNNYTGETANIRIGRLDDVGNAITQQITSNDRNTVTFTFASPSSMPKQHGFFITISGTPKSAGTKTLDMDIYSVKARVNYTGKTNLKTGFVSDTDGVALVGSEWQSTPGTYDFSNKINSLPGYSIAGVGVKYGYTKLNLEFVGPPAQYKLDYSKQLPSGSRVSIQNTTYSANVKYIDTDLQFNTVTTKPLTTMGDMKDTFYSTTPPADNLVLYYALDEDNTSAFSIADARDANLAVHINVHGTTSPNDFGTYGPFFTTPLPNEGARADIQWAVRPPLITGDIALSSSISVADTTAWQTHGVVSSEFDDISFSADTGSTLAGFLLEAESDLDTSFTQPDTEARIRVRADVEALSTEMDLQNTGLAGLIRSGYTIDPSFSISWADTLANNSIVPDVYFPAIPQGYFLNQAAQIMTGVFDFAATGLYGVLYDMPADRVGTYTAVFDTEASAFIYTDPSEARTFRPFYSRQFVFTEIADPKRHLHLDTQTRVISFDTVKDPKEATVYGGLKTSALRIHTVEAETRILDMRGTGD